MATDPPAARPRPGWLDSYLGLLQFLFLLTWIVYVIFLPDLLTRAGLPKDFAPRLLLADQLLFACTDVLLGLYADRTMNLLRRLTPAVLVLNLVSCLIFAGLPFFSALSPVLLIAATVTWVVTSTVLRAPLYGAIARRGANPRHGTAWALAGMGLASAAAPYLGILLKGMDPALPMLVSGIALALATLGFNAWERRQPVAPAQASARTPQWQGMALPVLTLLLLGAAFQAHFFLNAMPLFKQAAGASALPMLMPLFWVGFSLAVYPGALLLPRHGAARPLAGSAFAGALASVACLTQPGLTALIGLQLIAGSAWGITFLAALDLAGDTGRRGREATFVGLVFAALAVATALRIGLTVSGVKLPETTSLGLAAALWGCGALCAGYMMTRQSKQPA